MVLEIAVSAAAFHGQVQVGVLALRVARFGLVAPKERVKAFGMGVERDGQHVGAVVEDALGAVAVVQVDVEDGDFAALQRQLLGGNGGVVQVAKAAGQFGKGVVTGRAAQGVGGLALQQQFCRMDCALGRGIGCDPGVGADRGGGVGHVKARLTHGGFRVAVLAAGGVDVGDDLG